MGYYRNYAYKKLAHNLLVIDGIVGIADREKHQLPILKTSSGVSNP